MQLTHLVGLYRKSFASRAWRGRILKGKGDGFERLDRDQLRKRIEQVAATLVARGVAPGDRIAIWGEPRPEALICEFAAALIGATVVGMDPAWATDQAARVLKDADPAMIFVSGATLSAGANARLGLSPESLILLEQGADTPKPLSACTWAEFLAEGREAQAAMQSVVRQRANEVKLDDLAVITYRFDEAGNSLGVMLTHGNLAVGVANCLQTFELETDETMVVDRAPSDVAQRILIYTVILRGGTIAFPSADSEASTAQKSLRPTFALRDSGGIENAIQAFEEAYATSKRRRARLARAHEVAEQRLRYLEADRGLPLRHRLSYKFHNRFVFRRLREHLGGNLRLFITDLEPIDTSALTLLAASGVSVYSVLGWPETTWLVAANKPLHTPSSTWDQIPRGVEFRSRYDGALFVRGSNVTAGYWNRPAETETAIENRWFHTGLEGWLYDDGALRTRGADLDDVDAGVVGL
jgi:long-chain acyl-CoA synthetase